MGTLTALAPLFDVAQGLPRDGRPPRHQHAFDTMTNRRLLFLLGTVFVLCCGVTVAQTASTRFVRVAELQIDPAQRDAFAAATREVGQASVNLEDGCVALYAVADKDNPAFVRVFEVYRDPAAYQVHLQTPHFRKFRDTTNAMVTSRKLLDATPISLATKPGATP